MRKMKRRLWQYSQTAFFDHWGVWQAANTARIRILNAPKPVLEPVLCSYSFLGAGCLQTTLM